LCFSARFSLFGALALLLTLPAMAADSVRPVVLKVDAVGETAGLSPAADLLSVVVLHDDATGADTLRLGFLSLGQDAPLSFNKALLGSGPVDLTVRDMTSPSAPANLARGVLAENHATYTLERAAEKAVPGALWMRDDDPDAVFMTLPQGILDGRSAAAPLRLEIETAPRDGSPGQVLTASYPPDKAYAANCALVLHGNQGLGYSDVFHGRSDDLEGSGFDEALQIHESTGVPGNFHLSGTLQTAAEWSANTGDPTDFNAWLAAGAGAGWAGMLTSAYAQNIMPFAANDMNDWAVSTESSMVSTRYAYTPRVAWVPERVWLNTSGYPSSGVADWIGDNFQPHGVWGVILDDDVHLAGHDNHQIHFLDANGLRLIPRDRTFTGNIVGGNGQAALDILTGLASSGVGEFRIAVAAEDWEAVAEMGSWASATPNAKETYDWFVSKCSTESAWLSTWKLSDALSNPNFNGDTFAPAPGTYGEIGGSGGYGGGDNGWYTHWAGWIPWANGGDGNGTCAGGGNCKNYGTLWNDAYVALMAAPDNNVSQAGWYVLMTNLYETGWHDGLGGPISGWEHNYSGHMKQAMISAEASHWAAGEYATTTAAFTSDIDNDGYDELVMHNDHLFAVFEGAGGRLVNLFIKGPGLNDTAIGCDNTNWNGNADYNDANHVGAFSDVSPNYQHDAYDLQIVQGSGATVSVRAVHNEVTKEISLAEGDSFFDVVYRVGPATHWIQSGFSPSLVDLVWNAQMDRVWPTDAAYMGQRNPNTGVAAAWVLGSGGATHQTEFSGTLMKGDEVKGSGVFQMRLFAGLTSAPDGTGDIPELRALVPAVQDTIGPAVTAAVYYPASGRLQLTFDQTVSACDPAGVTVVEGLGATSSITLPGATPVSETGPAVTRTFELDGATAAAVEAMSGDLYLELAAGAAVDENSVAGVALTLGDSLLIDVATTTIAIDGNVEATEWAQAEALADSNDSGWTSSNEIDRLLVDWDQDYLYLAIDGQVSGNSWLLYLDVDPGSGLGQTDLTATDAWERGASFTAAGFAPDFQYGCYQHQSVYDGDGFWQLLSPTTTQDRSGEIQSAFDSYHTFGAASGSEIAIPWNTLYGLGQGAVPSGAAISVVASICWDPEPGGELGGDVAPNNSVATLPVVDGAWTVLVDSDGNGVPDGHASAAPLPAVPAVSLLPNVPNPFNPLTTIRFSVGGSQAAQVDLAVYDLRGRLVASLLRGVVSPGEHKVVWNGCAADGTPVSAGTYFTRIQSRGLVVTRPLSLVK